MVKSLTLFFPLGLLAFLSATHADSPGNPDDILIIVNRAVKVDVSIQDIKEIYLKRRTRWQMTQKVIPINAKENLEIRTDFRKRVLELSRNEENSYWQERKIKAGEEPPITFENRIKAVFKLRGSVSYIYRHQHLKGVVRVLLVLPAK